MSENDNRDINNSSSCSEEEVLLTDDDKHVTNEKLQEFQILSEESDIFDKGTASTCFFNCSTKPQFIAVVIGVIIIVLALGGIVFIVSFSGARCRHESGPEYLRVLAMTTPTYDTASVSETLTFSGGCFWSLQLSYDRIPAVLRTSVGYTGGTKANPTYSEVSADTTGHAEAVQVIFDPKIASYEDLLNVFFERHDPTTLNQQGNDRGSQYRSAIFYFTEEQRAIAEKLKQATQAKLGKLVVTEITPASEFWDAETYHQEYLVKHGYSATKGDTSVVPCYA